MLPRNDIRFNNCCAKRSFIFLCKFYGISADWLLGLKEDME